MFFSSPHPSVESLRVKNTKDTWKSEKKNLFAKNLGKEHNLEGTKTFFAKNLVPVHLVGRDQNPRNVDFFLPLSGVSE